MYQLCTIKWFELSLLLCVIHACLLLKLGLILTRFHRGVPKPLLKHTKHQIFIRTSIIGTMFKRVPWKSPSSCCDVFPISCISAQRKFGKKSPGAIIKCTFTEPSASTCIEHPCKVLHISIAAHEKNVQALAAQG